MYNEVKTSFRKHIDFIILDFLAMEASFFIAYFIRNGNFNVLASEEYRTIVLVIIFANLITCYIFNSMQDVIKREFQLELYATFKQCILTEAILLFFLFATKTSIEFSRQIVLLFPFIYFVLTVIIRTIYKKILRKFYKNIKNREFLIITTKDRASEIYQKYSSSVNDIHIKAFAIIDVDMTGDKISNVPVSAGKDSLMKYLMGEHVDEVLICVPGQNEYKKEIIEKINSMGIVIHVEIDYVDSIVGSNNKEFVEHIFDYTVLTCTVNTISSIQLVVKRLMDIFFGIIGTIFTIIFTIIIGPIIMIKSPGPIFFKQKRVGKSGKIFNMYKFRSMYMDAEERKKELLSKNEQEGDLMFKMKDDPRIIKGIGHFIRDYSIDEFPQFINVLKGDMSLVGTRPPTVDEWEKYSMHHRARLAIKPGITGLWQVSGRSNIKNFDEVVKLDMQYIRNFSIWLDIKIILKTFIAVFSKAGAR